MQDLELLIIVKTYEITVETRDTIENILLSSPLIKLIVVTDIGSNLRLIEADFIVQLFTIRQRFCLFYNLTESVLKLRGPIADQYRELANG